LLAVTISTIVYLCLICCALLHGSNAMKELSLLKRGKFVFTVALATEDFISDVLYYYVQVSPCVFERLGLSFECTSFASPALFYLSTTALFLPIFFYALYSGFLRGFLKALRDIIRTAWCKVKVVTKWLWGRDTRPPSLRWPWDYSGLNSHVPCDPPYRIIDWAIRRALLLLSTVIGVGLSIGFVHVALGLWVLLLLVLLFFGVNTKLFALRGYLDAYNSVLFLSDEQPRVRQVRDVNFALLAEVLFESIPQFIIVLINETSKRDRPDSATATSPREAAAGLLVDADDSARDQTRSFSGLAIFTLSMSCGMILMELIPFVYRALKAGDPVIGFYIPVLELDKTRRPGRRGLSRRTALERGAHCGEEDRKGPQTLGKSEELGGNVAKRACRRRRGRGRRHRTRPTGEQQRRSGRAPGAEGDLITPELFASRDTILWTPSSTPSTDIC